MPTAPMTEEICVGSIVRLFFEVTIGHVFGGKITTWAKIPG